MGRPKQIFECNICHEILKNNKTLETHIRKEHTGYKCKFCEKEFKTSNALGGHINLMHTTNKGLQPKKEQLLRNKNPEKFKKMHKHAMEKREAWRNDIKLTKYQTQFILGGLLGDASINMGNSRSLNARLSFKHSLKQYDYCMWKYEILKNIVLTQPKIEKNGGYGENLATFSTMSLPCLTEIYKLSKRNNETTITQEFLNEINDTIALATWFMDDGSRNEKNVQISLGNRSIEEVWILKDWMMKKWNIETKVYESKEFVMAITKQSESLKLKKLIENHVINSMKYKIQ
jgi:uncharacterized C2H2 Zn-finger protein